MNKANWMPARKTTLIAAAGVIIVVIIAFSLWKYSQSNVVNANNTAFAKYVEAYTAGVVSRESTVRVRLASQVSTFQQTNEEDNRKLFSINPGVKGKTYWIDARTVEFRPDEPLKPGREYNVTFHLSEVADVSNDLKNFTFNFKVIEPSYNVEIDGLTSQTSTATDLMKLTGRIALADAEQPDDIEKILTASSQDGALYDIKWQHNTQTRLSTYVIDSIPRGDNASNLIMRWDGPSIAAPKAGNKTIEIPAKGTFKVLDIRAVHEPEQYVLVQFSDPILVAQQLSGLIDIAGMPDLRYTIDGSEVKVYAPDRLEGDYAIAVNEGVENISNRKITAAYAA